jgi:hypothetical protein
MDTACLILILKKYNLYDCLSPGEGVEDSVVLNRRK